MTATATAAANARVHDRDREAARDPHPPESPDERVEQQRDQQRHEEEEHDVTHGAGHDPGKDEQERQPDELHPARDLDARGWRFGRLEGGGRHVSDGTAAIRRIRDDAWDWSFLEDGGAGARPARVVGRRARAGDGRDREPRGCGRRHEVGPALRLSEAASFDTVPPDMPSSRPNRRRRVERREVRAARRTRRFALLTLLAIVLVIALLLTAFGGGASQSIQRDLRRRHRGADANAAVSADRRRSRRRSAADADRAGARDGDRLPLRR